MKIKLVAFFSLFSMFVFGQVDPFVGEIKIFAGNFAPKGYAFCNGQLLPIAQNTALFSLLGVTYGGNGQTNFALPDLREKVVVGAGQGPGLPFYDLGETGGSNTAILTPAQLPSHNHIADIKVSNTAATTSVPSSIVSMSIPRDVFNGTTTTPVLKYNPLNEDVTLSGITTSNATNANSAPVNVEQPYLVCNYIIALQGIFPPRP
jgi:microcystin-dependent protein